MAREAAAQCRRVWLPEVGDTVRFADLPSLGDPGEVVLAQLSGDRPTVSQRVVAVGPEGGWSTDELVVGAAHGGVRAERAAGRDGSGHRRRAVGLPADRDRGRGGRVAGTGVTGAHGHGDDPGTGKFVPVIRLRAEGGGDPGA